MPAANELSSLDGVFKERYGDKLENAIPELTYLQKNIPFKDSKKTGKVYSQPVILGREHGVTYHQSGDGLITLEPAVAGQTKPAEIVGSEHTFRSQMEYVVISRSEDRKAAFDDAYGITIGNLLESARHRLEIDLFWGQDPNGLGTVASVTTGAAGFIVIDTAQWGAGIWNGMENAICEFFASTLTTARVAGVATSTITAIDPEARKITFDSVPTDVVATDVIFLKGMRTTSAWKTMVGLHTITTKVATTADPLFNIANSGVGGFNLWKASSQSANSLDLGMGTLLKAFSKVSIKGGTGKYLVCVSPATFASMLSDQGALRRYDKADSPTKYVVGAEDITFHTQTGSMMIIGHPLQKEGFAHGIPLRHFKRIGSTDITFETAKQVDIPKGASQYFLPIPDKNGVEVRAFSDQALFTSSPGRCFVITDIVNS